MLGSDDALMACRISKNLSAIPGSFSSTEWLNKTVGIPFSESNCTLQFVNSECFLIMVCACSYLLVLIHLDSLWAEWWCNSTISHLIRQAWLPPLHQINYNLLQLQQKAHQSRGDFQMSPLIQKAIYKKNKNSLFHFFKLISFKNEPWRHKDNRRHAAWSLMCEQWLQVTRSLLEENVFLSGSHEKAICSLTQWLLSVHAARQPRAHPAKCIPQDISICGHNSLASLLNSSLHHQLRPAISEPIYMPE